MSKNWPFDNVFKDKTRYVCKRMFNRRDDFKETVRVAPTETCVSDICGLHNCIFNIIELFITILP